MAAPVLSAPHRLRDSSDFRLTRRHGRRAGTRTLVTFVLAPEGGAATGPTRVGVVVGRTVGNAVTRNTVKRRLRHLASARLDSVPPGSSLVIQAHGRAAGATTPVLAADLDDALSRVSETT